MRSSYCSKFILQISLMLFSKRCTTFLVGVVSVLSRYSLWLGVCAEVVVVVVLVVVKSYHFSCVICVVSMILMT